MRFRTHFPFALHALRFFLAAVSSPLRTKALLARAKTPAGGPLQDLETWSTFDSPSGYGQTGSEKIMMVLSEKAPGLGGR